jgi:hypothetical protein
VVLRWQASGLGTHCLVLPFGVKAPVTPLRPATGENIPSRGITLFLPIGLCGHQSDWTKKISIGIEGYSGRA